MSKVIATDHLAPMTTLGPGSPGAPTILSVGPMLAPVLDATADLDATLLYTHTPRPLPTEALRSAVRGSDLVLVEPYQAGTSAASVTAALSDRPIRLLSIGALNVELRRYGTPAEHTHYHGLDAAGIRARLAAWL